MDAHPGNAPETKPAVLCVDDDTAVLRHLEQCLSSEYEVIPVESGEAAVFIGAQRRDLAVAIVDRSMPGMSGDELLKHLRGHYPDVVGILLAGRDEADIAAEVVKGGHAHRLVAKPFAPDVLLAAVRESVTQHRVLVAERDVLEHTVQGSVRALTHVLSLLQPAAFGRSERLAVLVRHMATTLRLDPAWLFEMAARLSHLGWVTLPPDVIAKVYAGQDLDEREREVFAFHPYVAYELLSPIPRLEDVAEIVLHQPTSSTGPIGRRAATRAVAPASTCSHTVETGRRLLAVAMAFDRGLAAGRSPARVVEDLRHDVPPHDPRMLAALEGLDAVRDDRMPRVVCAVDLSVGMRADQDVHSKLGVLLVAKGQELTSPMVSRLRHMSEEGSLVEPFRVLLAA